MLKPLKRRKSTIVLAFILVHRVSRVAIPINDWLGLLSHQETCYIEIPIGWIDPAHRSMSVARPTKAFQNLQSLRGRPDVPHAILPSIRCRKRIESNYYDRVASRIVCRANEDGTSAEEEPEKAQDSLAIEEQMLKKRRKKKKSPAPESKPYQVVSATRDSVYGDGPQSSMQQFETAFVQVLGILFLLILAEGIFLGASGFLSEEVDQFAQDVVYPLFSPTLGVFLAGSTAYGLWKTKEDESKKDNV